MKLSSQKYLVFFMTLVMVGIVMANSQNSDNNPNSNNKNGGGGKGGKFSPASKPTSSPTCYQPTKNIKGKSKKIEKNGKSKDMKGPKASKCTTSVGANKSPPPPPGYSGSGTSDKGGPKMNHNNKHAPTDSPTPAPISKKGGGGDGRPPPPPGVGGVSGPVVPGAIKGSDYSTGGNAKTKVSGKMASPTFSPTKPPVSIKGLPKGLRG
jgi:hypothetical protein